VRALRRHLRCHVRGRALHRHQEGISPHFARRAERIVRQNLIFAIGVMLTLVIFTVLVPIFVSGFVMPLPLGVVGHEGSTLIVVMNGLRLLGLRPK
jgi:cation transport ATPase